jgi:hypothetical protein
MSTEPNPAQCPDCGGEYKRYEDYYGTPQELRVGATTEFELAAEAHRDFECPVQREHDLTAGIEAALRYFGIPTTLRKIAEIIGTNEHDAEIIWGDADRWLKAQGEKVEPGLRLVAPARDRREGETDEPAPALRRGGIGAPRPSHSQGTS